MPKPWQLSDLPERYQQQVREKLEPAVAETLRGRKPAARKLTLKIDLVGKNARDKMRWPQRLKLRREYEKVITYTCGITTSPDYLQRITFTRILGPGQHLYDHSNMGGSSLIECQDALVACGYAVDDTPRYLAEPVYRQVETRRSEGPLLIVELRPV